MYRHKRVTRLRKSELPMVALAIAGHVLGYCAAHRDKQGNRPLVRIWGEGFEVYVLKEDWDKIEPYLRDGTFNPQVVAYPKVGFLKPFAAKDIVNVFKYNQPFYDRILGVLEGLFPEDYPTSNL